MEQRKAEYRHDEQADHLDPEAAAAAQVVWERRWFTGRPPPDDARAQMSTAFLGDTFERKLGWFLHPPPPSAAIDSSARRRDRAKSVSRSRDLQSGHPKTSRAALLRSGMNDSIETSSSE
jgi:hypothetical protein